MAIGLATDGWKRTLPDYVIAAEKLAHDMSRNGFRAEHPIRIDPNGELLDGSHRVACALALGLEAVTVARQAGFAWAPAWDEQWFVANGCSEEDSERIRRDYAALTTSGSGS